VSAAAKYKTGIQFTRKTGRSATIGIQGLFGDGIQFTRKTGRSATMDIYCEKYHEIQFTRKTGRSATHPRQTHERASPQEI